MHQPTARTIIIKVFARGTDSRLLVSTDPGSPRAHLTAERPENPVAPPRFCAYLRSRITNARVDSVEQVPNERILRLGLRKRTDGGYEEMTLVCELTGKSSNIILVDTDGVVCDSLKRFPAASSVRAVEPGVVLEPLPPAPGGAAAALPFDRVEGESWNEAADRFYTVLDEESTFEAETARVGRAIKKAIKRTRRKLVNLERDNAGAEDGFAGYKLGELLMANLHEIKRGSTEARLVDYTVVPPTEVTVPIDPALAPRENAERYFKKAKKSRRALEMLKTRVPETEREIARLEGFLHELDGARDEADVRAVAARLTDGGYRLEEKRGQAPGGRGAGERHRPGQGGGGSVKARRFMSSEGFELLCGRSGADNDLIVTRLAAPGDIWFHAEGVPGSHVIIRVAGRERELGRATIEEAAALAAYHSKARGGMKVDVIYSHARNVRKPRGAKPGLVTVREHKSIRVKPAEPEGGEIKEDG